MTISNVDVNSYTIVSGDTCWAISRDRGMSLQALLNANPGIVCENLQIGQQISLEGGGSNGSSGGSYSSSQSGLSTGNSCQDRFNQVMLEQHNAYRRNHGAMPLRLASNLISFARSYSSQLSRNNQFQHSNKKGMGENLAMNHGRDCGEMAKKMFWQWYEEKSLFDFNNGGFSGATGHFTQVVWKSTTHLGCGVAFKGTKAIGSCNYSPSGNYRGQFRQNVS